MIKPATTCKRCVLGTLDDSLIDFDRDGNCSYCNEAIENQHKRGSEEERIKKLPAILEGIKSDGKDKKYDCIIGCSGGIDSSYLVLKAVEMGLRPLIVHYDNGWNSEISVQNIENLIQKLNLDLYTHVNNWEEFRDIQLSFFKAHVLDIELITDQAIVCLLYRAAKKFNVKYIITGHNVDSESILPKSWYHLKIDARNIWDIHKRFGKKKMKTYPIMFFNERYIIDKFFPVETIFLLDFIRYNKNEAKEILREEVGWKDYGGKHFESIFTRFYQGYILPKKFNIDKRKAHYSSLIVSGQMTRDEALKELKNPSYPEEKIDEDMEFVLKKLGMTWEEFESYISTPPVNHLNYKSYLKLHYKILRFLGKQIA